MAEVSPLRRRMIEDMTIRNLSAAPQKSYVHHVHKLSEFCGRSPHRLGVEDVRAYQLSLVERGFSWGALNQTVCALRFFYGVTLGWTDLPVRIAYARKPRQLPVVLSAAEVVIFFEAVEGMKNRVALTCAYAAGLRVSEAARLKVSDIDSSRIDHPRRARQGRPGPVCDAFGAVAGCLARLLAGPPTATLAFPPA
jgi:integrase/recombinase XerD